MKLGVLTSHPIQYQAPLFRELAKRLDLRVFFAHRQTPAGQAAAGFGKGFEWDIDLLGGYTHEFLENHARHPDVSRFFGCDTPDIHTRIMHENFDAFLVMGWGLKTYWQAVNACRDTGVPVMVRGDSQLSTPRNLTKKFLKKILYPHLLSKLDACLYVGQRNQEYLRHFGVGDKRLFYSPHCVDNEWFQQKSSQIDRQTMRAELGATEQDICLLFVGKLLQRKRPADLIKACASVKVGRESLYCIFVGSGPLEPELRELAERLDVRVHFAGFVNQGGLPAYYKAADLLVLPSDGSETWGLVANESIACGTPVLVSDACGCAPSLAGDGKAGQIFPLGDIEGLALAIENASEWWPSVENIRLVANAHSVGAATEGIIKTALGLSKGPIID